VTNICALPHSWSSYSSLTPLVFAEEREEKSREYGCVKATMERSNLMEGKAYDH
jgi:hypothetical protein